MRQLTVQGATQILAPGWQVSNRINQRTTANFVIPRLTTLTDIDAGDDVVLTENGTVLFAGCVDTVSTAQIGPTVEHALQCTDYSYLVSKRVVYGSYTSHTLSQIIDHLITDFFGLEGVTKGTINPNPTIYKAVFNYINGDTALNQLADATGLNWNIDFDKVLSFTERSNTTSPWSVSDSTRVYGFRVEKTKEQYRNRQYLRGGYGRTSSLQDERPSPLPDGTSKAFTVRFPIAEKPTVIVNGTTESATDVGVNGLDTGKKWYFSYNSNIVAQDQSQVTLSSTMSIQVKYYGLYPILTVVEDLAEIDDRAIAEPGSSGIYENLTVESSINDSSQAVDFADALLVKYGLIPTKVTFSTEDTGLSAGQLLPIVRTNHNVSGTYLIESVALTTIGNELKYTVTALDGSAIGGWEKFFTNIINTAKGASIVIGENEVLIVVKKFAESVYTEASYDIKVGNPVMCDLTTICNTTLILGNITSEVTLNDI